MNHALPPLLQAAESARDQQAARTASAQQAATQAEATLQRLRAFRQECLARSAAGSLGLISGDALQDHQHFLGRLDGAIRMQGQELARCAQQAARQQLVLQRCQQRLLALQALRDRHARAAAERTARREQREADEFAARACTQFASQATA